MANPWESSLSSSQVLPSCQAQLKPDVPALCPVPGPVTNSAEEPCTAKLTCHGVFPGSVFSFSSVVSGVAASGLIVCFPFFEADHFSR